MVLNKRVISLFSIALILIPLAGSVVSAQDAPHIGLDNYRADRLDLNNDGDRDTIRVVYLLNTTSHYAEAAVQVDVEHNGMTLNFWDNTTFNRTTPYFGSMDIEAWGDGTYNVRMKVWDAESEMIIHSVDLGEYELMANLNLPYLRFDLEAAETIFLGDDCLIERVFLDEVGDRYDALGIISLSGSPWLVRGEVSDIDCSSWPARDYSLEMFYRNTLGFATSATLDFTIHTLPPPMFTLNVTGNNDEVGSICSIAIEPSEGTVMALMEMDWAISDPRGEDIDVPGFSTVDCRLWQVGLTKVRVTVTSPEGQTTQGAFNLVRLPPQGEVSADVKEAAGPENMWPDRSLGEEYEATPFFGESILAAQAVVLITGMGIAILLGLMGGAMWNRRGSGKEEYVDSAAIAFDLASEELPTYTDPTGVHWRQHSDGNVDWYDTVSHQWVPYQEV
ncbi:MAG: hypothetical protein H8D82_01075 [Euryarchaeota archaeon]|nr:hypothetical protein [Euryarchaeota archaeon]